MESLRAGSRQAAHDNMFAIPFTRALLGNFCTLANNPRCSLSASQEQKRLLHERRER